MPDFQLNKKLYKIREIKDKVDTKIFQLLPKKLTPKDFFSSSLILVFSIMLMFVKDKSKINPVNLKTYESSVKVKS